MTKANRTTPSSSPVTTSTTSTTSTTTTARPALAVGLLAREGTTTKLSKRAGGTLVYQVLLDTGRQQVFVRISANTGGGYFSREAVPVSAIRRCLAAHPEGQPLRGPAFKSAYINRSNNNAGFLAAALVAEGILTRDADEATRLVDARHLDAWERQFLALAGDLPTIPLQPVKADSEPADNAEAGAQQMPETEVPEFPKVGKGRRKTAKAETSDEPPVP